LPRQHAFGLPLGKLTEFVLRFFTRGKPLETADCECVRGLSKIRIPPSETELFFFSRIVLFIVAYTRELESKFSPRMTSLHKTRWNNQELRAAVLTYMRMLKWWKNGREFIKAGEIRKLRSGELKRRSEGSILWRFKNVSATLSDMERDWLPGYTPAVNVGANVMERIKNVIADSQRKAST
jgi:hypothetical protein